MNGIENEGMLSIALFSTIVQHLPTVFCRGFSDISAHPVFTTPGHDLPCRILSSLVMSCIATSCHVMSCPAKCCLALPGLALYVLIYFALSRLNLS